MMVNPQNAPFVVLITVSERFRVAFKPVCVVGPVWAFSSTYLRLGRKVLGLEIRLMQKTQRDTLATMVLLVS